MGTNLGGKIQGVSLDSFMQIVQMDQITCTLKVTSRAGFGFLYFVKGELFAATSGDLDNMEAACRIISWEDAVIEIEKSCEKTENEINQPLMNILMEGMRIRDEAKSNPELQLELENPPQEEPGPEEPQPKDTTSETEADSRPGSEPAAPPRPSPDTTAVSEASTAPPPGNTFQKYRLVLLSLVLIIVFTGAGLGFYFFKAGKARDAYNNVLAEVENAKALEQKVRLLRSYTRANEDSEFSRDAKQRITKIKEEMAARDFSAAEEEAGKLVESGDLKKALIVYTRYEKKHPRSRQVRQVSTKKKKLTARIDREAYDNLLRATDGQGAERAIHYWGFLKKNPKSRHRKEVEKLISEMGEEFYIHTENRILAKETTGDWETCLDISQQYIDIYPNLEHSTVLKKYQILCRAEIKAAKAFDGLVRQASAFSTDYHGAIKVFTDYLRAYPDTRAKDRINREIARLEELAEGERLATAVDEMITRVTATGKRFSPHSNGTLIDTKSGLMWTLLDSTVHTGKCLEYKEAVAYVEALDTGGHTDWRLPTPQELNRLYKEKPQFPSNTPAWYWSSRTHKRYLNQWVVTVDVVSTEAGAADLENKESWDCGTVRAVRTALKK